MDDRPSPCSQVWRRPFGDSFADCLGLALGRIVALADSRCQADISSRGTLLEDVNQLVGQQAPT